MSVTNFIISLDDLKLHQESVRSLDEILEPASEAIESGGKFTVTHARGPGEDAVFTTLDELETWSINMEPIRGLPADDSRYFVFKGKSRLVEAENSKVPPEVHPLVEKPVMGGPSHPSSR